ncbi:MAG: glycerol acyltransferase [Solirubrobacteraceae bacterium]
MPAASSAAHETLVTDEPDNSPVRAVTDGMVRLASVPGGVVAGALNVAGSLVRRAPRPAEPDDRDSQLLRDVMPLGWVVASLWFRADVRGLHHIPDGPVLFVGNRSGGNVNADGGVFTLAFASYFGPERPFFVQPASPLPDLRGLGILRRLGALPEGPAVTADVLNSGASVLAYPGGQDEAHRPSRHSDRIQLGADPAIVRVGIEAGVPIVPVVAIGGQETALFLGRSRRVVRRLGLERVTGRRVPVSLAAPWGINVGDALGHVPLPAKLSVQVLPPVDVRARFGDRPDPAAVHRHVADRMQETLTDMQRRRRLPVVG